MKKVILIAHGDLAREMKKSAEMIYGELNNVETISFNKEEGLETVQNKIGDCIDSAEEYLIFCDLFCGTPYNGSCSVALKRLDKNIEVVSGLSLPLLLEIASQIDTKSINELADYLIQISTSVVQKFDTNAIEEEEEL